jgi:hypothetical protein
VGRHQLYGDAVLRERRKEMHFLIEPHFTFFFLPHPTFGTDQKAGQGFFPLEEGGKTKHLKA